MMMNVEIRKLDHKPDLLSDELYRIYYKGNYLIEVGFKRCTLTSEKRYVWAVPNTGLTIPQIRVMKKLLGKLPVPLECNILMGTFHSRRNEKFARLFGFRAKQQLGEILIMER